MLRENKVEWRTASAVPPSPGRTAPIDGVPLGQGAKRWASSFDKFWGAQQTHDGLPAGVYTCGQEPGIGFYLEKKPVEVDDLIEFPDVASSTIIAEFDHFWSVEPAFRQRGFLHKRGFLLWGPPGSGKTSTLNILVARLVRELNGAVILVDHPEPAGHCLRMLRSIEPRRSLVCVLEDLDALVHRYGENSFLALLDGDAQVDNVVFVATTNYPERLDKRFVDRPSRFDTIRYIGMPSAAARRMYLERKETWGDDGDLDLWVDATDGFSIAHLKELIIAVKCLGQPFAFALARIEKMRERKPSSEESPERGSTGFVSFREAAE